MPCLAPDGHDEDGDGVDDACDVCPQLADDGRDSDGDGVGDACDLAPTQEQRVLFDPFTAMRGEWLVHPDCEYPGDSLVMPAAGSNIVIRLAGTPGRTVLETGGYVGAAGPSASGRQLASHIGALTDEPNYYCELWQSPTQGLALQLTFTLDGMSFLTLDEVDIGGALENGTFRMIFVHTPPELRCIAWWNGTRYEVSGPDPGGVPTEEMYLNAFNVDVELAYYVRLLTP